MVRPASTRPEGTRCPWGLQPISCAPPKQRPQVVRAGCPGHWELPPRLLPPPPPTLDEPLLTAPPPPDGEAQRRQPALRPWWLPEKGREGGRNGESGEHWRLGIWMQGRGKGAQAPEVREVPGPNPQLSVFLLCISLQIPLSSGEDSARDLTTWADSETPKST